jgi:hypothetical protein
VKISDAIFGTVLALDVLYFCVAGSFPPRNFSAEAHWSHVWNLAVSGGIAVGLTLMLTARALAETRDRVN